MEVAQVAGAEPAVPEGFAVCFRIVKISGCQGRSSHRNLSFRIGRHAAGDSDDFRDAVGLEHRGVNGVVNGLGQFGRRRRASGLDEA
jgi:hypothetical protein